MNTHRESSTITNAACVTLQVSSTCITADLFSSANVQSATAKLTAKIKQQTIIDNVNVDALMGLHKCERKNCPNHDKNGWCFDADGIHLKLNNVHLRSRSMAINEKEATSGWLLVRVGSVLKLHPTRTRDSRTSKSLCTNPTRFIPGRTRDLIEPEHF